MNNRQLLIGLLAIALLSGEAHANDQSASVVTLEELFEIAEAQSVQLQTAFSSEIEAKEELNVARTKRLPDINTSLALSYYGNGFTTKRNFSDYQKAPIPHFGNGLSLNINQPIYTGGAITAGIELADLKLTASRYATELHRDNIRFHLTGFYLDIYKYTNLRSVIEKNIMQAKKVLSEMKARYESGVALRNDITRYELHLSNLELQLTKINNTVDILQNNLSATAGLPSGMTVIPDSTMLLRALPKANENSWLADADENSSVIKLAKSKVDISRKAESIVRSERLPKIVLQAGWTIDGPILVEVPPINRNLSYWYVGVGLSYNLSSLFKSNKSITKSQAATQHAADELDAVREDIGMQIHADYIRYLESYEELKTQQKSVELARINYATTFTRYSSGMALLTDMLDAANTKLDAEQRLVNARIDIIYYYYKLLFSSGKI